MNKLKLSAYFGFIVGDALGLPYEFRNANSFNCIDMIGYGSHNQPPGTWSDDTSMLLATIDANSIQNIMDNYLKWYIEGKYTPHGICYDIGNTMEFVLNQYQKTQKFEKSFVDDYYSNGNSPLCRILPFAFFDLPIETIYAIVGITHRHIISLETCYKYYKILNSLITGKNFDYNIPEELVLNDNGFIVNTLNNALWCLNNTSNYKDAVLMAVNAGGDTDSTAAITGSLAGIKYGYNNIPLNWIKKIQNKKLIYQILTGE